MAIVKYKIYYGPNKSRTTKVAALFSDYFIREIGEAMLVLLLPPREKITKSIRPR